jgi:Fic family protein
MPKTSPDWPSLIRKLMDDKDSMIQVFSSKRSPTFNDRYIHWDKLQYLDPPDGYTGEMWWASLKSARQDQYRELPLVDCGEAPFQFMLPDPGIEYLHHIDQDLGGSVEFLDQQAVTSDSRDRYLIRSLAEEAITSSQLEGAAVTRGVAKEMLRTQRAPNNKDEQMILNNFIAMSKIRDHLNAPLSKSLILEVHSLLTTNTLDDPTAAGRFRNQDESIRVFDETSGDIIHTPPPSEELDKRISALCDFANGKTPEFFIHPVIRAIIVHFWLAHVHPFVDGNGRCARALFYWSMLKQKYWLCEYISISKLIKRGPAKYTRAFLYSETDDNDLTYFLLFHLRILQRAIGELHKFIARTTRDIRTTEELLDSSGLHFNHRQLSLLSHSLRNPDARYTIAGYKNTHRIVYQTARADLVDLHDKGLLMKRQLGKSFIFRPVPDLAEILKRDTATQ